MVRLVLFLNYLNVYKAHSLIIFMKSIYEKFTDKEFKDLKKKGVDIHWFES
ncbi:hypothetical protein LCGC14_0702640 [marine sediment metagenome]|uniref:Uncharacterized protein n=1 Tax=marine sediment metagenome TaxID=412755 RepID=A0A0F9QHE1_9ZZZZ